MDQESGRRLIENIRAAWHDNDPEGVAAYYAEDVESYDVEFPTPAVGREAIAEGVRMYLSAFPDSRYRIENVYTFGNTVVEQWSADGHHLGDIWGYPATGNYTVARGCSVLLVNDEGLVQTETAYWDSAGMYRQINALAPRPDEPTHYA